MGLDRGVLRLHVAVDADDHALAPLDLGLVAEARLGDLALEEVLLDRGDDAAAPGDLLEVVVGLPLELVGQVLEVVGAAERVDGVDDAGLVRDHLLRPQRDAHGVLGRERERLVEAVRVQRLRAAEHGRERLDRRAHDVELGLLRGQRHAGRLGVEAHQQAALVLRAVALAQLARPDAPGRAVLRDLLEEVLMGVEEERQPRRELVDAEPALERAVDVGEAVGERERELLCRRRARLADVVPGDRDRVPPRHLARAELHHVRHEPHRRLRRVDVLLLRDVFLEDVRLRGAAQVGARDALLLGDADVEGEQDRGRRVDRHRRRDVAQRDAREEGAHVVDRVDGDALAPDLAERARRDPSRSPSASACRTPSRGRSARARAGTGSARSSPRPSRSRRTAASSRGGRGTSTGRRRA